MSQRDPNRRRRFRPSVAPLEPRALLATFLPGDYDGDHKSDFAIFDPTIATFYVIGSTGARSGAALGNPAAPLVPLTGDYDGDGKTDLAVFDPTVATFYVIGSTGIRTGLALGNSADPLVPLAGDYDGDGKTDFAVFDPVVATFYVAGSTGARSAVPLGNSADLLTPLVGDYDGDGRADFAIFDSTIATFYVVGSTGARSGVPLGAPFDPLIPLVGDYDGDHKADFAVFDPDVATFYVIGSTGARSGGPLGNPSDLLVPLVGDYDGDGRSDIAVFDSTIACFFVVGSTGARSGTFLGNPADSLAPLVGDFDGDGRTDFPVFDPVIATFFVIGSTGFRTGAPLGNPADPLVPLPTVETVPPPSRQLPPTPDALSPSLANTDVNGDGLPDFVDYDPATATYDSRLSITNFPGTYGNTLSKSFGPPARRNIPILADINGDGRTDYTVYVPNDPSIPTTGVFATDILNAPLFVGDPSHRPIPMLADINGDGLPDFALYDPILGSFSYAPSIAASPGSYSSIVTVPIGIPSDKPVPMLADVNGDGRADFVVYDPISGIFFSRQSSPFGPAFANPIRSQSLGNPSDKPIPMLADINGDGRTDYVVYDPTSGAFLGRASVGPAANDPNYTAFGPVLAGNPTHRPIPLIADINGDGRVDLLVYDPVDAAFGGQVSKLLPLGLPQYSTLAPILLGVPNDRPVPALVDLNRDGRLDVEIYDPTTGSFSYRLAQGTLPNLYLSPKTLAVRNRAIPFPRPSVFPAR